MLVIVIISITVVFLLNKTNKRYYSNNDNDARLQGYILRINSERSVSLQMTVIKLVVSLEGLVHSRIWEGN